MSSKYEILREIFELENIFDKQKLVPAVNIETLLVVISQSKYSLANDMPVAISTVSKALAKLWPDRPRTTNKLDNWLLAKYLYKECKHCLQIKDLEEDFHKNSSTKDGYNAYCKKCQLELTAVTSAKRQAKYKAAKLDRIPVWADLQEISAFYAKCPEGYHVDHIIPLQGDLVSGLHVINNLQYLTAYDNMSKSNTFTTS